MFGSYYWCLDYQYWLAINGILRKPCLRPCMVPNTPSCLGSEGDPCGLGQVLVETVTFQISLVYSGGSKAPPPLWRNMSSSGFNQILTSWWWPICIFRIPQSVNIFMDIRTASIFGRKVIITALSSLLNKACKYFLTSCEISCDEVLEPRNAGWK